MTLLALLYAYFFVAIEMEGEKQTGNVVFLGAAGCGKSSLIDHLLHLIRPNTSCIEKYEKETAEKGIAERKFAWMVSRLPEERAIGHTINVSYHHFETEKVTFTLFDVPGKRQYAGNLIAGLSCSDIAFLVVSAQRGEFEADMGRFGQTREQLITAYALGIKQVKVVINKLDTCNPIWIEDRYEEIKTELAIYLRKVGFHPEMADFVPISAWHGFNLTQSNADWQWYSGATLLQVLTKLPFPKPELDQPLRLSILEAYRIAGVGTVAVGKVHTGTVCGRSVISFLPIGHTDEFYSLERHHQDLNPAKAGLFIGFAPRWTYYRDISRGFVVTDRNSTRFPAYSLLTAQLIVLCHSGNLRPGHQAVLYCHTAKTPCRLQALKAILDRQTGEIVQENPSSVQSGDVLLCTLRLERQLYVEEFKVCPALGRLVLRDMGVTVAVGVVKEVQQGSD